jgi:lambda repressor-like predicted transcriptional regulator
MSALADKLKVSRQAISGVLSNPLASIKLEKQIAEALSVSPYAIWPARWQPNGEPVPRYRRSPKVQKVQ